MFDKIGKIYQQKKVELNKHFFKLNVKKSQF